MATPFDDDWVPEQYTIPPTIDLRGVGFGPRGYSEKKKHLLNDWSNEKINEGTDIELPLRGEIKRNIKGVGKVSKRPWKMPGMKASTIRSPGLRVPLDRMKQEKEVRKKFKAEITRIKEVRGAMLKEKREKLEKRKAQKEENIKNSLKTQKITNPKTLKKMQSRKKLKNLLIKK